MQHRSRGRRRPAVWSAIAAVTTLGLVASACGSGSDSSEGPDETEAPTGEAGTDVTLAADGDPTPGGALRYGLGAETDGWNPTLSRWAGDGTMVGLAIFDPLAAYTADGDVAPYLAESFDHNSDFTEWTIGLRDGPTFHDGTPVDAAAVAKTLEGFRQSPLTSANLEPIELIETPDPRTVVIHTKVPWSSLPVSFTGQAGAIAAPAQLDDPDGARNPVGSGPFEFVSWEPDTELVVERYDDYWRTDEQGTQLPYLDEITFLPITEANQRINALATGDLDMTYVIDADAVGNARELAADGDIQVVEQPGQTEVTFVMLNLAAPPFDDPTARQALAHATDRDAYAEVIGNGVLTPARTLFRPDTEWYSDIPIADYDPAAAEADLAAWSEAHDGQPLSFTLNVQPTPYALEQGRFLQEQWEAVGMEVELKQVEATSYLLNSVMGQYEAVVWGQFGSPDPDYESVWWRSTNAKPIGEISLNFPRNIDEAVDEALDDARSTDDPAARKEAFDRVQERLAEDLPYIYLTYLQPVVAAGNRVRGITNGPLPDGQPARPLGGPGSFSYHTFLTQTWVTDG